MDKTFLVSLGFMIASVIGATVAYRKYKPENDRVIVSAAEGVVVIQGDYIKRQEARMAAMEKRQEQQLDAAESARKVAELALVECNKERRELTALYEQERDRNRELRARVEALEAEVAELKAKTS